MMLWWWPVQQVATVTYGGDDGNGVQQSSGEVPSCFAAFVAASVKAFVGGRKEYLAGEVIEQVVGDRCPVLLVEDVQLGRHRPQPVHVPLTHLSKVLCRGYMWDKIISK